MNHNPPVNEIIMWVKDARRISYGLPDACRAVDNEEAALAIEQASDCLADAVAALEGES
jgi:hypothetical protein